LKVAQTDGVPMSDLWNVEDNWEECRSYLYVRCTGLPKKNLKLTWNLDLASNVQACSPSVWWNAYSIWRYHAYQFEDTIL